jgi:predicted ATPase
LEIKELYINNFKSLIDFKLIEPNPFTVFVGPNGAGKSNIFEALEYINISHTTDLILTDKYFGGKEAILNFNNKSNYFFEFFVKFPGDDEISSLKRFFDEYPEFTGFFENFKPQEIKVKIDNDYLRLKNNWKQFYNGFCRVFINNRIEPKQNFKDDSKLLINASNLEKVLGRILLDKANQEEFMEWIQLFVPEFDRLEVITDKIDGESKLRIFEKFTKRPLNKALISDGTFNILAILAAVFQSDEPQFLLIEEPENGLNPKVIKSLVNFFRDKCEEKGHFIWLNTHSQTLVSQLRPEEIIIVDKKNGVTQAKQFKDLKLDGMPLDEAWLTNTLGGGLPW